MGFLLGIVDGVLVAVPIIVPLGITYKFNPSNLTLTPGSHATVTMQITAAPDTEVRSYNLSVSLELTGINIEQVGYSTILTIVEGNPLTANTTNTTTSSGSVASNVTTTITSTQISTSTMTELSTQTSTSMSITTLSTMFTSAVTTTSMEMVTDPSTYAWALSATVAAVVLAVVLLLQRTTSPRPR